MKKIILLLGLFFSCLSAFTQNPQLVNNSWYLEKMVLDNTDYFPENFSQIHLPVPLGFTLFMSEYFFSTSGCDTYGSATVTFDDLNSKFALSGGGITLGCTLVEFDELYFFNFFKFGISDETMMSYVIEDSNGNLKLTLTNDCGDTALYNGFKLNVNDFSNESASILAFKNQLSISSNSFLDGALNIYKISGKIIHQEKIKQGKKALIDISNLMDGIYIAQLQTKNSSIIKKFIKN